MLLALGILMDALFITLLAWCVYSDMRKRTVPNLAIALLLCLGFAHMVYILLHGEGWWQYPAGLLLVIPFLTAWLKNSMGAGDVKLIAAVSIYLGFLNTLVAFALMVPVLSTLLALSLFRHKALKRRIPLAPVIGVGAAGAVLLRYLLRLICH